MRPEPSGSFGEQLKALREAAGFTQEELATIAGLSVHAVSALERGERRRPQVETLRALSAALDLTGDIRDALAGSARAATRPSAADQPSATSLPLALTALVGRDADVQTVRHWLADPAARLVTLVGPGGVGKTRLALEIARAIAGEGVTRVVFVPLAAAGNPAFVASAIAEAIGLSDVTAIELPQRARMAFAESPTLLALDNFEHVLDAAPLVASLLAAAASLKILVTSRAPLRVRGEREYAVGPLALDAAAAQMSLADLARVPAIQLFLERVRDVRPDFRLTDANGPAVTAICRRLDALPLALELAAPWIKVLTPDELRRRVEHDVLLAADGPRDLPERQQTMNATVAWSYQLLTADEQRAFRRFGALPGLFPIDAAAAVLAGRDGASVSVDEALGAAAGLIDKSLLMRAEGSVVPTCPLYQMLETVRAYAANQLVAAGEHDDATEGLVRYSTSEAALAAAGLVGPDQIDWLDRVREDLASYRAALAWLIEHGRASEAAGIAWGLLFFWVIRGRATEGLRWYEQILSMPSPSTAARSRALAGAAVLRFTRGELDRARDAMDGALALARGEGDLEIVAHADNLIGHIEHALGNTQAARDRFHCSAEEFRALAQPWGTGNALMGLAWATMAAGDTGQAEKLLDEAALVLRQAGPWFLQLGLYVRAVLAVRRGEADQALAVLRESLTRTRDLHDRFALVYALVPLASAAALKGEDTWAARICGARDAVTESTGVTVVDKSVDDLKEQVERDVRARLGPERWARSYATGRGTSIDALLTDIDRLVGRTDPGGAVR